jgi:hypothetical protein
MSRVPKLDPVAECCRLMFFQGAALMAFKENDARARETARYFWNALPFLKALMALVKKHPEQAAQLWQAALEEPMPLGAAPLEGRQVPLSEAQLTEWRAMAHNWVGCGEIHVIGGPGPGEVVLTLLDAIAALTNRSEEAAELDKVLREALQQPEVKP